LHPETEIRQVVDRYYDAFRQGELRSPFFWRDPGVATMHPLGGRQTGWDDVTAVLDAGRESGWQPLEIRLENFFARVVGDCAWAIFDERAVLETGDGPRSFDARVSNVYVRQDGEWRIALHHASMPDTSQIEEIRGAQHEIGFESDN
jgi:ketosteroid isomerase-like protein